MLEIYEEAYDGLALLNSVNDLRQLEKVPSLKLHHLTGDRKGQRAFWVGKTKYRVCFR
jgi:plasmid maintenance system killer protein